MTDLRKTAQALVDKWDNFHGSRNPSLFPTTKELIDELRQTLAQPERDYERGFIDGMQKQMQSTVEKAVNSMTKQWQNLTDDEIKEIVGPWGDTPIKGYTRQLFDKIEAKLKEKNT